MFPSLFPITDVAKTVITEMIKPFALLSPLWVVPIKVVGELCEAYFCSDYHTMNTKPLSYTELYTSRSSIDLTYITSHFQTITFSLEMCLIRYIDAKALYSCCKRYLLCLSLFNFYSFVELFSFQSMATMVDWGFIRILSAVQFAINQQLNLHRKSSFTHLVHTPSYWTGITVSWMPILAIIFIHLSVPIVGCNISLLVLKYKVTVRIK